MSGFLRRVHMSRRKVGLGTVAALAGFATAALVGLAVARPFTLQVARNGQLTSQTGNTRSQSIVVSARGRAVYELTGDGPRHAKCTRADGCFSIWPPLTVSSPGKLSKAPGIKGRLGTWHRDGFFQVTLGGHPLYRFAPDSQRDHATGEGIRSFGGTWHAVRAATPARPTTTTSAATTGTSTSTNTTSTTTPTTCLYPGYC